MNPMRFFLRLLTGVAITAVGSTALSQPAVPMLINYQGELRLASTDLLAPDGTYDVTFRIHDVESGGAHIWEGIYSDANGNPIEVSGGIFSVLLGSGTGNALDASIFDGADRWLEIEVGYETLSPRQRISCVAYAMKSQDSHLLDGREALDFAEAGHTHSGGDIVSGVVSEARLATEIARDNEIMPRVLSEDGSGSTLDADFLDGRDSTDYASASHTHDGADIATGTVAEKNIDAALARDSEVNAKFDTATGHDHDGTDSKQVSYTNLSDLPGEFPPSSHEHSGSDITTGTVADGRIATTIARDTEVDSKITTHAAIADAHHAKTTSFSELTDAAADAQIPNTITINYAASAGDADTVDGVHAAALEESTEIDSDIAAHAGIPDAHHTRSLLSGLIQVKNELVITHRW